MAASTVLRDSRRALWEFLVRSRRMGITGRLILTLSAVAVLAAAANLVAEHGVSVIETQTPAPVFSPLPLSTLRVLPGGSAPNAAAQPPPADQPAQDTAAALLPAAVSTDAFMVALERFQRALEARAAADSDGADEEFGAARKSLDQTCQELDAAALQAHRPHPTIEPRLRALQAAAADTVQSADARRAAVRDYTATTDAMAQRLARSLHGAWKIFGRVLARQSLLQLQDQLGQLRLRGEPAGTDAATRSEAAFETALDGNNAGLVRSEGDAWMHAMRGDFAKLVDLRHTLAFIDAQAGDLRTATAAARGRLLEVPAGLKVQPVARAARSAAPTHAGAVVPPAPPAPPAPPVSSPLSSPAAAAAGDPGLPAELRLPAASAVPVANVHTITTSRSSASQRRTVAWITAAVLAVLLSIAASTIYSIVVPVRRLLKAAERIAGGEVDVRVARGGIKELDILSAGFNRMAEQLSAAREMTRDYQQRLEEKVEQRTRQLQHLAEHDPLTHLPNRRQLFVLLNHALERAAQSKRHVGVFFTDIDNFKNLNDSMGHGFGDQVLTGIATRLKLSAQAFGFAGRLGGDEFTIVYEDAASLEAVVAAGQQLIRLFDQPLSIEGRDVIVRASVGASLYPNHGRRAEDLLSAADAALFRAKALGRGQLAMFTPELLESATRKYNIEQGLRRAIERDEFVLVYQPQVNVESMRMVMVESLLRWRQPDGRHSTPAEFLEVTEESGLIIDVGKWVLRHAIECASQWHHGRWPEARVAINVSPRQLLEPGFAEFVLALLDEHRLPTRCIELELTEAVLQSGRATLDALRHLSSYNIAVALDDFGTGYSSLASLENLPLSRIKLDRSLIAGIDSNTRSAAIASALIGLCRGLDLEVTAEGVERPEQMAALARYGSIDLQGYLISRPVAADEVIEASLKMPQVMQDLLLSRPGSRTTPPRAGTALRPLASAQA